MAIDIDPVVEEPKVRKNASTRELPKDGTHITYQIQRRQCGKPSCKKCANGGSHGPYVYAFFKVIVNGKKKPVSMYISTLDKFNQEVEEQASGSTTNQ